MQAFVPWRWLLRTARRSRAHKPGKARGPQVVHACLGAVIATRARVQRGGATRHGNVFALHTCPSSSAQGNYISPPAAVVLLQIGNCLPRSFSGGMVDSENGQGRGRDSDVAVLPKRGVGTGWAVVRLGKGAKGRVLEKQGDIGMGRQMCRDTCA